MKLSHMRKAYGLAMERRNLSVTLDELEQGEAEISVNGWPVEVNDVMADAMLADAASRVRARIAAYDKQLAALGVVIDLQPDEYVDGVNNGCGDPRCDVCTEVDDEDEEDGEADPGVDTAAAEANP